MSNEWAPAPPPRAPRKWPKRLLWTLVGLLVFFVLVYFVVTSSLFFESIVLPRVSQAIHAEITVSSASISPFRRVALRDLEIKASRLDEPILKTREVSARYSLWNLLRGRIRVREVLLDGPTIQIVEFPDGRRNIDPLLAGMAKSPQATPPAPEPGTPSAPPDLQLTHFLLTNAQVRYVRHGAGGGRDVMTVSGMHVSLTNLANGAVGGLHMGAGLRLDHVPDVGMTNDAPGTLRLEWGGAFQCWMDKDLQPEAIKGQSSLDVRETSGSFPELSEVQAVLDAELSMSRVAGVRLAFRQGDHDLGRVRLFGPLSVARREGSARLEISGIDRRALNLAGAALGLDFGNTTLNATNDLKLALAGQVVSLQGNLRADRLSVVADGKQTVPLDLNFAYELNLDAPAQTATVQAFTLSGRQDGARVLQGQLSRPMQLNWSETDQPFDDSAFDLMVTNFHLADWSAFLGDVEGTMSTALSLTANQGGRRIQFEMSSDVNGLAVSLSSNRLEGVGVNFSAKSQWENFRALNLEASRLTVLHESRVAMTADLSGKADTQRQEADFQVLLNMFLPSLAGMGADPNLVADAGEVRLMATIHQAQSPTGATNGAAMDQSITGQLRLLDFTGRYGEWRFQRLESLTDFQATLQEGVARLAKWETSLRQNEREGGTIRLGGELALSNSIASASLEIADLNEHILQSFVPATAEEEPLLQGVRLGLKTEARHDPRGASLVRADLEVADLLLPGGTTNSTAPPISLNLGLTASLENGVAELREMKGAFMGNGQPAGQLTAAGRYDMSNRSGRVSFDLESLDQAFLGPLLARSLGERSLSNGVVHVRWRASHEADRESVLDGEIRLENWVVHDPTGALPREPLEVSCKLDGGFRAEEARLSVSAGNVLLGGQLGGQFSIAGSYQPQIGAGEGRIGLTDINHKLLGPFLAASLDGKELASLSLNSELTASYQKEGESRLAGSIQASDFLIRDPTTNQTLKPLSAELGLNVGWAEQVLSLDSVKLGLSPTVRARNELSLTGRIDLSDTNSVGGQLQLTAESLDLTPYYDFFVAQPSPPATEEEETAKEETDSVEPSTAPKPAERSPPVEPAPMALPFRDFAIDTDIGRMYLREIEVSEWNTKARLDASDVSVKPLAMKVNGAPLSADTELHLGVPGYRYDVALRADRVPVGPVANTLMPESHGQYQGDLITEVQIKGAGITGASLRSNLVGKIDFSLTNAVVNIDQPAVKAFLLPVAVLLRAPDLLKTSVTWVGATMTLGEGKMKISRAGAISPLFAGATSGDITIGNDLMLSSLDSLPVTFCLQRDLARQARLLPRGVPKEDTYVLLPPFINAVGTLGEPASKLDKLALTGSLLKKIVDPVTGSEQPVSSANPFDLLP